MGKLIDLTGQKFGKLEVICKDTERKAREAYWICKCDCGNMYSTRGTSLRNGRTTSCGCDLREKHKRANYIDLTGQVFGELTVLSLDIDNPAGGSHYLC